MSSPGIPCPNVEKIIIITRASSSSSSRRVVVLGVSLLFTQKKLIECHMRVPGQNY